MAKTKYKLQRTEKRYSPIIAVLGGKHHTDYMPVQKGTIITPNKNHSKSIVRKKAKGIFRKKG